MTQPFYVSPEQLMKDRADFARKGIARGRSVVVLGYDGGIAFATENPSRSLHKVSEIYDRIAFAAVGKYNEFENLRVAGVRYADLRGYSYDRNDVTARGLANAYAQTLGAVFTTEAETARGRARGHRGRCEPRPRTRSTGSPTTARSADEPGHVVMGGDAERLGELVRSAWRPGLSSGGGDAAGRQRAGHRRGRLDARHRPRPWKWPCSDRTRTRRAFRRLISDALTELLAEDDGEAVGEQTTEP